MTDHDPDRDRRIAQYHAEAQAKHDAWCREQAAKAHVERSQAADVAVRKAGSDVPQWNNNS